MGDHIEGATMYADMDELDQRRRQGDAFVNIIVGDDAMLQQTCAAIAEKLRSARPNISRRMDAMINRTLTSNDRVAKHGFLFFALYIEPWAYDIILEMGCIDKAKYAEFKRACLKTSSEQLLNGAHTSLRSYVEEVRLQYIIT